MYFREVTTVKSKCSGNEMLHVASKAGNPLLPYLSDRKNTRKRFRTNIEITLPSNFHGDGETFLVIQWLRFHLPMQGTWVQSLVWVLRSHMSCGQKNKIQNRSNNVIHSIKTLKYGLHQKYFYKKGSQWVIFIFVVVILVAHSCLTLCNPIDCSLPGSSVDRII